MSAGYDRSQRGQRRAARLLANFEEARRRARHGAYDRQAYDGSQGGVDGQES